jgi:hypothetical protein
MSQASEIQRMTDPMTEREITFEVPNPSAVSSAEMRRQIEVKLALEPPAGLKKIVSVQIGTEVKFVAKVRYDDQQ